MAMICSCCGPLPAAALCCATSGECVLMDLQRQSPDFPSLFFEQHIGIELTHEHLCVPTTPVDPVLDMSRTCLFKSA